MTLWCSTTECLFYFAVSLYNMVSLHLSLVIWTFVILYRTGWFIFLGEKKEEERRFMVTLPYAIFVYRKFALWVVAWLTLGRLSSLKTSFNKTRSLCPNHSVNRGEAVGFNHCLNSLEFFLCLCLPLLVYYAFKNKFGKATHLCPNLILTLFLFCYF